MGRRPAGPARSVLLALSFILLTVAAGCGPAQSTPASAGPAPAGANGEPYNLYAPINRPDVSGTHGAVVAGHPQAAAAGYDVLRAGGNAVDAAVTMAAVLAVVRPHMNGVGGDAFGLFYSADTQEVYGLNGSGRAGALATPEFFAERGLDDVPGSGPLSITVPGAVSAWAAALERFGTISLEDALAPAIGYAENGFVVSRVLANDLTSATRLNDAGQAIYAPGGVTPQEGTLLRNTALAGTLKQIAAEGPKALYGGSIGQVLASFLEAEGSYLRADDFVTHTASWVDPLSVEYTGRRIYSMPPNSQGVALLMQMAMAPHFPLQDMGHNSADYLHTIVEMKKLAFADRDRWVTDPEFEPSRAADMLDPSYLRTRAALLGARTAESVAPGLGGVSTTFNPGDGAGDTVYLMAVDQDGNAVSWIQSLFGTFGSRVVEPTTGIVLQNRGGQFTLDREHPNVVAPGKRPYHTLTPHLVTDASDNSLRMTFGTPGGDGQTQTLFQVFNNIFLFGMSPQEAVEAPRYRSSSGTTLSLESRIDPAVRVELARRGHEVNVIDGWSGSTFGGAQVILVDREMGTVRTGADPRREAYGIAY
ncbi:MAG: gamma-glutamyltransferase [Gemmatimonas sp.]|nr:gamma-glutamyltransferase [Gemmatimonas sp.]